MSVRLLIGDCRDRLRELPDQSVQCVVTSPPYFGLRDYGVEGQLGVEPTPQEYTAALTEVFREVWRVLRDDGTVWLNLGDSYVANAGGAQGATGQRVNRRHTQRTLRTGKSGNKGNAGADFDGAHRRTPGLAQKNLLGIPWRVAFALQDDGWYLRQDIIWHKPNPMPESVRDRCTKAHEYLFMLTKSPRYYYDSEAIKEQAIATNPGEIDGGAQRNRDGTKANEGRNYRDKQRGHSRRHDGFNARWDSMTKVEQQALGRNKRSVWEVATRPYSGAHFATFPPALIEPCIRAGTAEGHIVLDPFAGSGTVGYVADYLSRDAVLIEMNPEYESLIRERMGYAGMFNSLEVR